MRGFGAVQACFAYESQMDALAARSAWTRSRSGSATRVSRGLDARHRPGHRLGRRRWPSMLRQLAAACRLPRAGRRSDLRSLPGGVGNTTHGEGVRRGVGYGVGIKNICFSEGFDDYSTARVRLEVVGGEPVATVHTAAAEVGQGLVTLQQQIARTELGVDTVIVRTRPTPRVGSAGSSSASRQSYMTGGAVKAACEAVRGRVLAAAARSAGRSARCGWTPARSSPTRRGGARAWPTCWATSAVEETVECRHRPTDAAGPGDRSGQRPRPARPLRAPGRGRRRRRAGPGQGGGAGRRAGRRPGDHNPRRVEGQIHGGTAQGLGLALMEEIQRARTAWCATRPSPTT